MVMYQRRLLACLPDNVVSLVRRSNKNRSSS